MKYSKPPRSFEEHLIILEERGLKIEETERAIKYLRNIGYFRLTGYMYHLQESDGSHRFKDETTFSTIIQHYHFDKKLRSIVIEYLERIEVSLRARLTNYMVVNHGFFWYTDRNLFDDHGTFIKINDEIVDSFAHPQERFLKAFKNKYEDEIPPSNMAMEILSLGKLTRLYQGLKNNEEKIKIASDFGLPNTMLASWLIFLNNVRNICAHHGRLWNRGLTADRPIIPQRPKYKFDGAIPDNFNSSVYGAISLIDRLLTNIKSTNRFIVKIENLIDEYPVINTHFMGFPENWREEAPWKKVLKEESYSSSVEK